MTQSKPVSGRATTRRRVLPESFNAAAFCRLEPLESRLFFSAGQLDPTFGKSGIVSDSSLPRAAALAVQTDGKVVEASQFLGHISLARFNADGSPDKSFGYFGRLNSDISNVTTVRDLALQPDGKIVVAGGAGQNFLVTRYNSNGSPDTTFGTNGVVTTDFGFDEEAHAIALNGAGQIIVAGISVSSSPQSSQLALARYNANGSLDTTFGSQGKTVDGALGIARDSVDDVAVGADGKPVVVGSVFSRNGLSFLIERFNVNGSLDGTTFTPPTQISRQQEFNAVAVQSDGKILAAGESNDILVRYNSDGTLDAGFGKGGSIDPAIGQNLSTAALKDLLLQPDGKIVVGGIADLNNPHDFYLARYTPAGTLDPAFGTNGIVDTPLGFGEQLTRIAIGPGGTILAAGGSLSQLDLARYTADGSNTTAGGSISGTVYDDATGNGIRDGGESASVGRQVYLDLQGIDVLTASDPIAVTDANGHYIFNNLPSGNYLVRLAPRFDRVVTAPLFGGKFFVQLGANQNVGGDDFGTRIVGPDAFPVGNPNLVFFPGVTNGRSTLTSYLSDGSVNLAFGTLGVVTLPPTVTGFPTRFEQMLDGTLLVNYPGQTVRLNQAGMVLSVIDIRSGTISGTVYGDTNGNGVQDAGETGVAGRQVYLDLPGIGVFSTGDPISTTDANGQYSFTGLPAANYLVRLVPQAGRVISAPLYGGKFYVQLGQGQAVTGEDFGTQAVGSPNLTQDDGKQLVLVRGYGSDLSTVVLRYNTDGSVDIPFGVRGAARIGGPSLFPSNFDSITLRPDGNFLIAGTDNTGFVVSSRLSVLTPTGTVLNTTTIGQSTEGIGKSVVRIAVGPDNKIIAGGTQLGSLGPVPYVQRFNADLSVDPAFGPNGDGTVTLPGAIQLLGLQVLSNGSTVLTYANKTITLSSAGIVV